MWQKGLLELKDTSVVKMRRILQSVFYLLQYKREDVCINGTNKLFWKVAQKLLDDSFIDKLVSYSPCGSKAHAQAPYTTINFIEKNIEGIVPDDVDA